MLAGTEVIFGLPVPCAIDNIPLFQVFMKYTNEIVPVSPNRNVGRFPPSRSQIHGRAAESRIGDLPQSAERNLSRLSPNYALTAANDASRAFLFAVRNCGPEG